MIDLNKRLKHKLFPTIITLSVRLTLAGIMSGKEYIYDGLRIYPIGKRSPRKWAIHYLNSNKVYETTNPQQALSALLKHAWGIDWKKHLQ